MHLKYIQELIDAQVLAYEKGIDLDIKTAFGSDLMSDVLAYVEEDTLLITGLTNQQVIRTAEMLDLKAILFVRGKEPCKEVIELAEEKRSSNPNMGRFRIYYLRETLIFWKRNFAFT